MSYIWLEQVGDAIESVIHYLLLPWVQISAKIANKSCTMFSDFLTLFKNCQPSHPACVIRRVTDMTKHFRNQCSMFCYLKDERNKHKRVQTKHSRTYYDDTPRIFFGIVRFTWPSSGWINTWRATIKASPSLKNHFWLAKILRTLSWILEGKRMCRHTKRFNNCNKSQQRPHLKREGFSRFFRSACLTFATSGCASRTWAKASFSFANRFRHCEHFIGFSWFVIRWRLKFDRCAKRSLQNLHWKGNSSSVRCILYKITQCMLGDTRKSKTYNQSHPTYIKNKNGNPKHKHVQ